MSKKLPKSDKLKEDKVVKIDKPMDGDEFLKRLLQVKKEDLKKKK